MMNRLINKKMVKRLDWITSEDEKQSEQERKLNWLCHHLTNNKLNNEISFINEKTASNNFDTSLIYFIELFLNEANYWSESADTREDCRNLKAAWKAWDKRDKNKNKQSFVEGSYTISVKARKELESLANGKPRKSFSSVIETLLLDATSIKLLQQQLKKNTKNTSHGIRLTYDFLSSFFSDEKVHDQASAINQVLTIDLGIKEDELKKEQIESKKLKKENSDINIEMDDLRKKILLIETENSKLKISEEIANKERDELLGS
jgi:hypothetical protein